MKPRIALFNDTSSDQGHYGCALVMEAIERLLADLELAPVFRWPVGRDWRAHSNEMPERGQIDAVVVNGEGTMHGAPHNERAVALAKLGAFARDALNVPSVLINASLFGNDAAFYEDLRAFDLVVARDRASQQACTAHDIPALHCPDLTFAISAARKNNARQKDDLDVGFTGSVIPRTDFAIRQMAKSLNADFRPMVDIASRDLSRPSRLSVSRLRKALRARKRVRLFGEDVRFASAHDFVDWISNRDLIVTGRYHTVTLAILTHTPFLYLDSNSPKIQKLIEDVGLIQNRKLASIEDLDQTALRAACVFTSQDDAAIEEFLKVSSAQYQEVCAAMGKAIFKV
ncbi:polysaccharide pyruvyl transferase family protein [Roseobacter sp.]|uniref:polysaccharide pyruvyl transferase family protein n=1 Tax=Roseobacter sp. TaxID=1907202 RepID=UPI0032987A53